MVRPIDAPETRGRIVVQPTTCILISAFEGYVPAAELSRRLLDRYWAGHPPVWFCGAAIDRPDALPVRHAPGDWMAGVRNAMTDLEEQGFDRVYLLMADLGPIAECHSEHLNRTIPNWMDELGATYISIRGWDHRRSSAGPTLGGRYLRLQQQDADYRWRFALHPALWRTEVLARILDILMARFADHSAWSCEIEAGNLYEELPKGWNERTFRVCGRLMATPPIPRVERMIRHGIDSFARNADRLVNGVGPKGPSTLGRLTEKLLRTKAVYYQGPYPIYFQGFFERGKVNPPLVRMLRRQKRFELLQEIEQSVPRLGG